MKVLAINGSSRKNGNTYILLKAVLKELNESGIKTKLIQLSDKDIDSCRACFSCSDRRDCIVDDDFNEIFCEMKESDGIILGSPVYLANISSKMQAFLERSAVISDMNRELFKRKVGAGVAAGRRGGLLNALDSMNHFFLNHDMFVVGSSYWNIAYGQRIGDVNGDKEGIETMKNLGKNMAFLLNCIKEEKKCEKKN